MKKLSILLLIFISNAFGCPNLSGRYICNDSETPWDDNYSLEIDQSKKSFDQTDILADGTKSTTRYLLDGKTHRSAFGIRYQAKCQHDRYLEFEFKTYFFVRSWLKYIQTDEGFTVFRRGSKREKFKVFKTCKQL